MRRTIFLLCVLLLLLSCTRPPQPQEESGLEEITQEEVEKEKIKEVIEEKKEEIKEEIPKKEEPVKEVKEEKEESKKEEFALHKRKITYTNIAKVLEHTRKTRGINKIHMNEDVCDVYKYSLQHLRLRKIAELYGVSCPRTFLFFGYERGSFLYTIDDEMIVDFVEPIDDTARGEKEFALLLDELSLG